MINNEKKNKFERKPSKASTPVFRKFLNKIKNFIVVCFAFFYDKIFITLYKWYKRHTSGVNKLDIKVRKISQTSESLRSQSKKMLNKLKHNLNEFINKIFKSYKEKKNKKTTYDDHGKLNKDFLRFSQGRSFEHSRIARTQAIERTLSFREKLKKFSRRWAVRIVLTGLTLLLLVVMGVIGIFIYYARDLPTLEDFQSLKNAESTKIYDRTGKVLLYEIHGEERRTVVKLDQIPDSLINATIAIEDKDFYKHHGINIKSFFRAFRANVEEGEIKQGASTITQQLIKNTVLSRERTLSRKIREIVLALELERKYSKDEILELYLNRIPYGSNAYGSQAAAKTFFDKDAKDISLAESTILAALPNRPSYLSPYGSHIDKLEERQAKILNLMEDYEMISSEENRLAVNDGHMILNNPDEYLKPLGATLKEPHFVFYVKEFLEKRAREEGLYGGNVETAGLKVTTTIDLELQQKAREIVREHNEKNKAYDISNMALAALEPDTGHIVTMIGSAYDYNDLKNGGRVNVTIRYRQPGSSFKPYTYAAAFQRGYTPKTVLYDVKTKFEGGYTPSNFSMGFSGPVDIKSALIRSLNIPAVKAFYLAGTKNVISLANKMGLEHLDPEEKYGLATSLGSEEVKLIDHLGATAAFATRGYKVDKTPILKIENNNGEVLEDNTSPKRGAKVMEENIADMMNYVLSGRTGGALIVPGHKTASKTGTTNKRVGGRSYPSDTWTVGYTPEIAAAVWTGNNDGSVLSSSAVSTRNAAPAWRDFMIEALKQYPKKEFHKAEITASNPALLGKINTKVKQYAVCKFEGLLANEHTPESQKEIRKNSLNTHSILHYVNRDDPNGPPPSSPGDDPQYQSWEKAIRTWVHGRPVDDEEEIKTVKMPTEHCTVHNPENRPTVSIQSPSAGQVIKEETLTINANATSPLSSKYSEVSIQNVEFYLNGIKLSTQQGGEGSGYSASYDVSDIPSRPAVIKVIATDSIDNSTTVTQGVNIQTKGSVDSISISPSGNITLPSALTVEVITDTGASISNVNFYYKNPLSLIGSGSFVGKTPIGGGKSRYVYTYSWGAGPPPGNYQIYATANINGTTKTSNFSNVIIN